jgi:glutamate dehydrogenase
VKEGIFGFSLLANEVNYFYNELGLDEFYFGYFTPPQIAKHIHVLIAAKKIAEISKL